jgi:hypothetical protein
LDDIISRDTEMLNDDEKLRSFFGVEAHYRTTDGKRVALAPPEVPERIDFVRRDDELRMCQAAFGLSEDWSAFDPTMLPLHFRLEGPPGVGKNEIVYEIARRLADSIRMPFYSIQGHEEMTPEDLSILIVPESGENGDRPLALRASPLATALYEGGLFFFDEINRAPERALTPLASVLDRRRSLYSAVTGITMRPKERVKARFRFCCAMNPDQGRTGRGGLSDYLDERTLPAIHVGYHDAGTLTEILRKNVTPNPKHLEAFREWYDERRISDISVRQVIALMTFAIRTTRDSDVRPALDEHMHRVIRKSQIKGDVDG